MADYIIQKAVELRKVKKNLRKPLDVLAETHVASLKYDGCCAVLGSVNKSGYENGLTLSRTGARYKCLDDHAEYLMEHYPDLVFIVEAWWPGADQFNLISGEFRRFERSSRLLSIIHDIIPYKDFINGHCPIPYRKRQKLVSWKLLECEVHNSIMGALCFDPGTYGDPQAKCNAVTAYGGYDGLVLRDPNGTWTRGSGTTGEIIKIKRKLSYDLRVLEVNTVKGEKTGRDVYKLVVDFHGSTYH